MTRKPDLLISRLPNKGKLESALQGEKNLISLVYECKMMPNKIHDQLIREKLSDKDSNISSEGNHKLFTLLNVTMMQDGGDILLQDNIPSILLNDVEWINRVYQCFEIKKRGNHSESISPDVKSWFYHYM